MDYIQPMIDFQDKLYHLHFKDITIDKNKLDQYGYFAPPNSFSLPKIPGHGDIDWSKFITTALDVKFKGYACIEIEDRNFEDTLENRKKSLILSKRYLNNFI